MAGLGLSESDWIAIATISTGAAVSIVAVYLGYRLQLRTSRRERLLELASATSADLGLLWILFEGRVELQSEWFKIKSWPDKPTREQLQPFAEKVAGVNAAIGVSPFGGLTKEQVVGLTKTTANDFAMNADFSLQQSIIELGLKLRGDAAALDLVRPNLGFEAEISDLVKNSGTDLDSPERAAGQKDEFRSKIEGVKSNLRRFLD